MLFEASAARPSPHGACRRRPRGDVVLQDGGPPKIIHLDAGNAGTDDIATQLRSELRSVERLLADTAAALLILHL